VTLGKARHHVATPTPTLVKYDPEGRKKIVVIDLTANGARTYRHNRDDQGRRVTAQ